MKIAIYGIYKYLQSETDDCIMSLKKRSSHIDSCLYRCLSVSPTAFACRCHSDPKTEKDNTLTDKNTKTKLKIQYHARNMYHYIDVTYSRFFMV